MKMEILLYFMCSDEGKTEALGSISAVQRHCHDPKDQRAQNTSLPGG